jgi:hypothetical protein
MVVSSDRQSRISFLIVAGLLEGREPQAGCGSIAAARILKSQTLRWIL